MKLETARLTLFATELKHFELVMQSKKLLGEYLGMNVPPSFPESEDALPWFYDLVRLDETLVGWLSFWALHRADNALIASIGFKGKPDADGKIEIGYSVIPEYRRQGFASEMVEALLEYGFTNSAVTAILAQTRVDNFPSMKVLERFGMKQTGTNHDEDEGEMFVWKLERGDYEYTKAMRPQGSA
jgi:[ribosomal protein S5]-alanine N-acetyltransferase